MVITDSHGLPIAIRTAPANTHEVKLVEDTLKAIYTPYPRIMVADKAYDSDALRKSLDEKWIDLVVPHRRKRKRPKMQDKRKLTRYRKRWKIERYFAWLHNYRRCVVRYDYKIFNFEGFILLASTMIYLKKYF